MDVWCSYTMNIVKVFGEDLQQRSNLHLALKEEKRPPQQTSSKEGDVSNDESATEAESASVTQRRNCLTVSSITINKRS